MSSNHVQNLFFLHTNLRILKKIKERGFNPIEVTIDMIEKENDEERLLVLQSEQEAQEVDENESLTNVMYYLDDNTQDEDDDFENDDVRLEAIGDPIIDVKGCEWLDVGEQLMVLDKSTKDTNPSDIEDGDGWLLVS